MPSWVTKAAAAHISHRSQLELLQPRDKGSGNRRKKRKRDILTETQLLCWFSLILRQASEISDCSRTNFLMRLENWTVYFWSPNVSSRKREQTSQKPKAKQTIKQEVARYEKAPIASPSHQSNQFLLVPLSQEVLIVLRETDLGTLRNSQELSGTLGAPRKIGKNLCKKGDDTGEVHWRRTSSTCLNMFEPQSFPSLGEAKMFCQQLAQATMLHFNLVAAVYLASAILPIWMPTSDTSAVWVLTL